MMKKLLLAVCTVSLMLSSCSDSKKNSNELDPTVANLAGTWKAETYKLNGNEIPQSRYLYDYIQIGQDSKFTARFGLLEALDNQDGYCYGPGTIREKTITLLTGSVTIKAEVTSLTENRLTVKNTEGYVQTFSRVASPTLYRVANKTTSGATYPSVMLSFATDANNNILFQSVHGLVPNGSTCDQLAYTSLPKAMHVVLRKIVGTKVYTWASVYPQKMTEGSADNVIAIADTTMVIELEGNSYSNNMTKAMLPELPAKPLSEWMDEMAK